MTSKSRKFYLVGLKDRHVSKLLLITQMQIRTIKNHSYEETRNRKVLSEYLVNLIGIVIIVAG